VYDDYRATDQAAAIAVHAPGHSAARGPASALAKLLWLRDQGLPADRRVLSPADWLAGQLHGRFDSSDWNNALKFGFDPQVPGWPRWLDGLAIPSAWLPARVLAPGAPAGVITKAAAAATGLPAGTRIVAGTTDGVAGFLAAGPLEPGEGVTSLGSTLVLKIRSPAPVFDAARGVYSHRLAGDWVAGGASNSGGAALARFFDAAQIQQLSREIDPDRPSGCDFYPLPRPGERFPDCDPAREPVVGPRPDDDLQFLHGLLEGVARIEAAGYAALANLGAPRLTAVRTVGGGAANETWRRIREHTLGVPVRAAPHDEPAYGAALLAAGRAV